MYTRTSGILDGYGGRVTVRSVCGGDSVEIVRELFPDYQEPHDVGEVGRTPQCRVAVQRKGRPTAAVLRNNTKETRLSSGHVDIGK
jgi:hypothetical protein